MNKPTVMPIARIVNRGDWACAYGRGELLARACAELAAYAPATGARASAVSAVARIDMSRAALAWHELVVPMRRRR